jgi:hypothetical protein
LPSDAIPYEEIDCEIRSLVQLLNSFPGIRTEFSCAGHEEDEQAYVTFAAASHTDLKRLLSSLPPLAWRSEIVANHCRWCAAWVEVGLSAGGELRYHLRVAGAPQYMQRRLLGEIERSLVKAVAGRPG